MFRISNYTIHYSWLQNDSDADVTDKIAATSAPRLPLQIISILNAVVTLIASYFTFIADYPKGYGGQSKNVY